MTEDALQPTAGRIAGRVAGTVRVLRTRLPFTSAVVLVMIVLALVTGSFWRAAEDAAWYPSVAYGVPSLEAGRWWTLLSGPFFAVVPVFYLAMTGSFAVLVGWAEWRLGTRLATITAVVGQLVGILTALGFLFLVRGHGWAWADRTAELLDVGFSAGSLAAAAVTSAVLRPPWRLRLRLALGLYVLASAVYLGSLADLEHLVAVGLALAVGPRLVRGRLGLAPPGRPSRREWRLLAVFLLVLLTVGSVLSFLVPNDGPLGETGDDQSTWLDILINLVITALAVNGLRKGHRVAWRWVVGWAGLNLVVGLGVPISNNTDGITDLQTNRTYVVSIVITAVIAAPIVEEMVFRGVVLRGLRSRMGAVSAIVLQGVLFGCAHLDPVRGRGNLGLVMVLSGVGIAFGAGAVLLRRIGPTIVAHAIFNGVVLLIVLTGVADRLQDADASAASVREQRAVVDQAHVTEEGRGRHPHSIGWEGVQVGHR